MRNELVGSGGGLVNSAFRTPHSAFEAPSLRLGALGLQFPHRLAAQAVQLADGQQNVAGQGVLQLAQFERRAAQAPKLLAQAVSGERLLFGPGERHRRVEADHVAEFVPRDEGERLGRPGHALPSGSGAGTAACRLRNSGAGAGPVPGRWSSRACRRRECA